jgi:hypothetical protein
MSNIKLEGFIMVSHAAQHDAGNLESFTKVMNKALTVSEKESLNDPVASFLAALIVNNNGDIDAATEGFDFWMSELKRVHEKIK